MRSDYFASLDVAAILAQAFQRKAHRPAFLFGDGSKERIFGGVHNRFAFVLKRLLEFRVAVDETLQRIASAAKLPRRVGQIAAR